MELLNVIIDKKNIAYKNNFSKINNPKITIVFLCGFMSDMEGTKSQHLQNFCTQKNLGYLCFDYSGHGQSSGNILDGCISDWLNETVTMVKKHTTTPVILVGSSMGGWLSLLAALELSEKVVGILNIAPAVDFTEILMWDLFSEEEKKTLLSEGLVRIEKASGAIYNITKKMIEDGRKHLLLTKGINLDIPIILLHGLNDNIVPVRVSLALIDKLTSDQSTLIISKSADHRMSSPQDLDLISDSVAKIIK